MTFFLHICFKKLRSKLCKNSLWYFPTQLLLVNVYNDMVFETLSMELPYYIENISWGDSIKQTKAVSSASHTLP